MPERGPVCEKKCTICGLIFVPTFGPSQITCSQPCGMEHKRRRRNGDGARYSTYYSANRETILEKARLKRGAPIPRTCETCGKGFMPAHPHIRRMTCSDGCQIDWTKRLKKLNRLKYLRSEKGREMRRRKRARHKQALLNKGGRWLTEDVEKRRARRKKNAFKNRAILRAVKELGLLEQLSQLEVTQ